MNEVQEILTQSVKKLLDNTVKENKIQSLKKKHNIKLHFIPYRYRVFGGLLQSMNIQFGNFLEKVIAEVLSRNPDVEIIEQYSGKKSNKFELSLKSDRLIDTYISDCQTHNYDAEMLKSRYTALLAAIKKNESESGLEVSTFNHDVDILFRDKRTQTVSYVEVKYNDDHDTDKFVGINRKLLKTYAYLQRELGQDVDLRPILFYFNNKRMKGNIYIPEDWCIFRGERFFKTFTDIKYEDLDFYMKNISESSEVIKIFDNLYQRVVKS
ncbi:MAG: TdeIII family type II restriction endonuclease [Clostridiales bacterium]|nr:TdeIII family type II restriction endonuclease [Clostridiales bacterium]